jgi:hypothetical protein
VKVQKKEQREGMLWYRGQHVPILYSTSRKYTLGSENWIARGTTQRIGATIIAVVFFCGSLALFAASPFLRVEIVEDVHGILGQIIGALLAVLVVVGAGLTMFLSFRLVRGVVRSYRA